MPNIAEFKDWLFVKVPEDAHSFHVVHNELIYRHESKIVPSLQLIGEENLLPGPYQIIGKGDLLAANQWAEIFDRKGISILATAAQELKSLGFDKPEEVLILKK